MLAEPDPRPHWSLLQYRGIRRSVMLLESAAGEKSEGSESQVVLEGSDQLDYTKGTSLHVFFSARYLVDHSWIICTFARTSSFRRFVKE